MKYQKCLDAFRKEVDEVRKQERSIWRRRFVFAALLRTFVEFVVDQSF